jgi:hypothetical protein
MDAIEKKIYTAFESRQSGAGGYCGHGNTEDELETQLWEYAEGLLDEEEEEAFWEQVRHCPYCLEKLLTIQKALNTVQQQPLLSADELYDIVQQRTRSSPVLSVHARLFQQTLTILSAVYQNALEQVRQTLTPQYATPVPVLDDEQHASRIVRLQHRINGYEVELELEQVPEHACDVAINITMSEQPEKYATLSIALYTAEGLIVSRAVRDGHVTFQALKPGPYTMRIECAEAILVEIELNIT